MDNFGQRIDRLEKQVAAFLALLPKIERQEVTVGALVEIIGVEAVQAQVDAIQLRQAEHQEQRNLAILRSRKDMVEVPEASDRSFVVLRHEVPQARGVFNPMVADAGLADNEKLRGKKVADVVVNENGTYLVVAVFDPAPAESAGAVVVDASN